MQPIAAPHAADCSTRMQRLADEEDEVEEDEGEDARQELPSLVGMIFSLQNEHQSHTSDW
jgi:hypothetical protein